MPSTDTELAPPVRSLMDSWMNQGRPLVCSKQAEIITLYVQRLCPRRNTAAETVMPQLYHPLLLGLGHRCCRDRGRGMDRMASLGLSPLELMRWGGACGEGCVSGCNLRDSHGVTESGRYICVTTWSLISHEVGNVSPLCNGNDNTKHPANCKAPSMRRTELLVTAEESRIRPQKELPQSCAFKTNGSKVVGRQAGLDRMPESLRVPSPSNV